MKTYEVFTASHSFIVQATNIAYAIPEALKKKRIERTEIIAIVEKEHPIAKEFKIS